MHLSSSWWASLVYVFDFATWSDRPAHQATLQGAPVVDNGPVFQPYVSPMDNKDVKVDAEGPPPFDPPYPSNGPPKRRENIIQCNYEAMGSNWKLCNGPKYRGCWLKGLNGEKYDITTDYETKFPRGITRRYTLDITEKALAPDGVPMAHGKVFNGDFPGPWIQACWGDDLEITVRNHLRFNGTTIRWHGIRQLNNTENDGVNGVTQCPVPPGQELTYRFKAMQYGSSWYHSHYSLQYADGLVGPMTIYGPSSEKYDYAEEPILITDWNHRSAYEDWSYSLAPNKGRPMMTNILLNGKGNLSLLIMCFLLITIAGRYIDPKTNKPIVETKRYTKILEKVGLFGP